MTIPKPLLPLNDMPILEVVLRQLAAANVDRVVLAVGPMAPLFRASFEDGSRWGLRIEYCMEEVPLGTAGALRLVKDPESHLLVMNGDILTTLDYGALVEAHLHSRASGTIAVSRRQVAIDYGVVRCDINGLLDQYEEKPHLSYEVSMGINVLSRSSLDLIPAEGSFDMPDLMLALKRAGERVFCYTPECYWQDIGRFDDYKRASEDFTACPSRFLPFPKGKA